MEDNKRLGISKWCGVVLLPGVGWVAFDRDEVLGVHPSPHAALRTLEGWGSPSP
ncbi:MAG: hypothetical protein QXY39_09175 [Thermofilaceae archaeon]